MTNGNAVEHDYDNDGTLDYWENDGGGILLTLASPGIVNCIIRNNASSDNGGGIYSKESSPQLHECVIQDNTATVLGGGICLQFASEPVLADCFITGNSASFGSGFSCSSDFPLLIDTQVCGNLGREQIFGGWSDGGGVCIAFNCDDGNDDGIPDECLSVGDGVHEVPSEFATIQEAVEAAGYGDTV